MTTRLVQGINPFRTNDASLGKPADLSSSSLLVVTFFDEVFRTVFLMGLWLDLVNALASSFQTAGSVDYALPQGMQDHAIGFSKIIANEDILPTILEGTENEEDGDEDLWA